MPFGVRLKGELNEEVLRRSVNEIVRRHEVLRTKFVVEEGEAVQKVEGVWEVEIERIDIGGEGKGKGEVERWRKRREGRRGRKLGER